MEKYTVLCLSNQPFSLPLKTNKWHVMTRLAKLGHRVIFVDPPVRFRALKALAKGDLNLKQFVSGFREESMSLLVYSPVHLFNFKPFSSFNTWLHLTRLRSSLQKGGGRKLVVWIYHFDYPDLESLLKGIDADLIIYDVVDEYSAFPEYASNSTINRGVVRTIERFDDFLKVKINQGGLRGKEWVSYRENWLAKRADLIFASAPGLVLKFQKIVKGLGRPESLVSFLPNCGDFERYKDVKKYKKSEPKDVSKIPHPRIITSGAIDSYKMNLPLIELCARTYPNYSFVLIGDVVEESNLDLSVLRSLPNIYFLGFRPYESLPYYFAACDAYFIPYNLNDYTIGGCFPVKFHDALSAGLPTVVTNLPAYKPFKDVCYVAQSDRKFVDLIKVALEEDSPARFKARQEVAKNNTWEGKVESQLNLIRTAFAV